LHSKPSGLLCSEIVSRANLEIYEARKAKGFSMKRFGVSKMPRALQGTRKAFFAVSAGNLILK